MLLFVFLCFTAAKFPADYATVFMFIILLLPKTVVPYYEKHNPTSDVSIRAADTAVHEISMTNTSMYA